MRVDCSQDGRTGVGGRPFTVQSPAGISTGALELLLWADLMRRWGTVRRALGGRSGRHPEIVDRRGR